MARNSHISSKFSIRLTRNQILPRCSAAMEISPRSLLPRASLLPAGFIEDSDNHVDERPPADGVLAGNCQRPIGSPKILRSKISDVVLPAHHLFPNFSGYWQDDQAKEICSFINDERSGCSRTSSGSLRESDWLKCGLNMPTSIDSDGKGFVGMRNFPDFLQENSWTDDILQCDLRVEHCKDCCLEATAGIEKSLDKHGEDKDRFTVDLEECLRMNKLDGLLSITNVVEACDFQLGQIVEALEELKRNNEDSVKELFRIKIDLHRKLSVLLYQYAVLDNHFARAIKQKDILTLLSQGLQSKRKVYFKNESEELSNEKIKVRFAELFRN